MDKLDILNRKEFVENLISLTELLSNNKKNASFAIDGDWGVGKSFILDMYEEKLSEIQSEEKAKAKYFIIRYNCWEYDYYEEPLIAIVSKIIETIEQKTKLFPNVEKKSKILGVLKAVGVSLLSMANSAIQQKTGVDFGKAYDVVKKGIDSGSKIYELRHDYDVYFGFNRTISSLREALKELADEFTIIFLVDELDRCLPEYAIKVLERLHHLTGEYKNIITVLAIDKFQLETAVKNLFGFDDPKLYLKKFIGFELKLDRGHISEKLVDKYFEYISLFDKELFEIEDTIEEYMQAVFNNIDARNQKRIIERAFLIHKILFSDKKDYSFMCLELLLIVVNTCYKNRKVITKWLKKYVNLIEGSEVKIHFENYFDEKLEKVRILDNPSTSSYRPREVILENMKSLYGIVMFCWYNIFFAENKHTKFAFKEQNNEEFFHKNIEDLKKFHHMLKVIK